MASPKIVIGIDFGTTHSGVSWALNGGQKKIRLITDWPNPNATNANADKVPTVISYKDGKVQHWGYDVELKEEAFRWFKILLQPDYLDKKMTTTEVRRSSELLKKLGLSAQDVVSDYLRQLWEYTRENIRKRIGDDHWENSHDIAIVVTVPAIWSHSTQDKTLKAARAAGMPAKADIELVTEPSAAAIATLRDKSEEKSLQEGDIFVVCDAGGGTVDLISYRVKGTDPLRLDECVEAQGGLCGSVFLDTAFENCIKTLVGERQYEGIRSIDKKKMLRTFDFGVKRSFSAGPNQSRKEYSVDLRGVEDNEEEGILDETISLKQSMLQTVFDHVCGQVEVLVHNQVSEVKSENLQVKSILLVGGFGSSKYLHHRLETSYRHQNISVLQVDGAYGVLTSQPFDPARHELRDRYVDESDGSYWAGYQMEWLVRRGDRIKEGQDLTINLYKSLQGVGLMSLFSSRGDEAFENVLYFCKEAHPPSRYDDAIVKELCKVRFIIPGKIIWEEKSFKGTGRRGKWRRLNFEFNVRPGNATLRYEVKYRGAVMGDVEATYTQW
ncbi:hypothetical protein CkaCkLH20_07684 [Colletotrichum karsti]|uniref:Actin-like ATPase domain-containing protein n=1 Tax=Colletotrichum karsti TaxID=1095194 RepID=A0A9P6IAE1_9PEZI|nr:uncharacterized protein CkaCkLH20_07684 [Colletotrichum karsti]KAF9874990.1 hypothetical protein CkaCkLH20_07684 [Colletotrichum karsti]